jgi:transcriptional accessory protein Tex/SPT6
MCSYADKVPGSYGETIAIQLNVRPGRDPRADTPAPILRSDVLKVEDLAPGLALKGTVRKVVDFGAFVDIGVKHDGLLHRTQIPFGTALKVGDIIDVEILKTEPERSRIILGWRSHGSSTGVKVKLEYDFRVRPDLSVVPVPARGARTFFATPRRV